MRSRTVNCVFPSASSVPAPAAPTDTFCSSSACCERASSLISPVDLEEAPSSYMENLPTDQMARMEHSKFGALDSALEACTRSVIHPNLITEIPGHAVKVIPPQNFQPPSEMDSGSSLNSVLKLSGDFHTYRDILRYHFVGNPDPDCDVPEAEDETIMEENHPASGPALN